MFVRQYFTNHIFAYNYALELRALTAKKSRNRLTGAISPPAPRRTVDFRGLPPPPAVISSQETCRKGRVKIRVFLLEPACKGYILLVQ